jgi:urease accessory protein
VQHGLIDQSSLSLSSFLLHSLVSYAQLNLPFFRKAHDAVSALRHQVANLEDTVETVLAVDAELETMMLNHVTRRASKAQGVALLTLYSRAFTETSTTSSAPAKVMDELIAALKKASRKPVTLQGHLPVCFAVLTAALGLSLGE